MKSRILYAVCRTVIVLLSLFQFGCDNTNPVAITDKAIYSEFSVVYQKGTNKSVAKASFWQDNKSGPQVFFNPDAKLTYQDILLEYVSEGTFYTKEIDGFFTPSTFKVVDINKKSFINSVTVNTIAFPAVSDTVDASKVWTVAWTGTAVEANETITLRLDPVSTTSKSYQQKTAGATGITVSAAELSAVKGKTVVVSIERVKLVTLDQDLGAGGILSVLYVAQTKSFYFK